MTAGVIEGSTLLVTGGAGFVGSHLVEQLLEKHPKRLFVLDNLIRGSRRNMSLFIDDPRVVFVEGDVRDSGLVRSLLKECDYCFHLAALRINACAANPREGFEVMAQATFDLIEAAIEFGIRKFIYSSTASVYGLAQHFPTPESDHPYDNQTLYGAYKLLGEGMLRSFGFMKRFSYVALRYFNVYGPRMDTDGKYTEVMIRWLRCISEGIPPEIHGDGSTSMDFVHVRDVARANVLALEAPVVDQVFNIGCQRETSLRDLLYLLLAANGSSLEPIFMPTNVVNPVSRRLADISAARNGIGFEPTVTLEEGLRELSRWYFESREQAN